MRLSYPMPVTRSRTFAPTASHSPAMVLMKVSLVARNAFEAYLMSSEVVASVMTAGAPESLNSSATRTAASRSSAPTTTRSGLSESATAVPSRRNSGLETTTTSARPMTRSTSPTVPTGTVDLFTMIAPSARCGAISAAAAVDAATGPPSRPSAWGVSTQRNTNSAPCDRVGRALARHGGAPSTALLQHLVEPVLDDGRASLAQRVEAALVALGDRHEVAVVREDRGGGQAHVAGADDARRGARRPSAWATGQRSTRRAPFEDCGNEAVHRLLPRREQIVPVRHAGGQGQGPSLSGEARAAGGSSALVGIAVTEPGRRRPRPRRRETRPNHVVATGVCQVHDAARVGRARASRGPPARSAANDGQPRWSSTNRMGSPRCRARSDGELHDVAPVEPRDPRHPRDRSRRADRRARPRAWCAP